MNWNLRQVFEKIKKEIYLNFDFVFDCELIEINKQNVFTVSFIVGELNGFEVDTYFCYIKIKNNKIIDFNIANLLDEEDTKSFISSIEQCL